MRAWPVRRILSGDCPPTYLETFDRLAGRSLDPAARPASDRAKRWAERLDLLKGLARSPFAGSGSRTAAPGG